MMKLRSNNMRKYNYEIVKLCFEEAGYKLIDKTYVNCSCPMLVICSKGHKTLMSYSNFKAGKRCKHCCSNAPVTYDRVKKEFEKRGYKLLSRAYKKSSYKLRYICPRGTEGAITWNSFQQGHGCACCAGRKTYNIEKVRFLFEEQGAKLLSNTYINTATPLRYICKNGHSHEITLDSWKAGHRCPSCAGNTKNNIEDIRKAFKLRGYELLEKVYINNKQKLKYRCNNGHIHHISYGKFKFGRGCPTCAIINNCGSNNCNWKGGVSFEPYCEAWKDKEYKESIKDRDQYRCLNPACVSKNPKDLTIHHIDYNKKNCRPENLITICRSCNAGANTNRGWYRSWYQALIYRRYSL